MDWKEYKVNPPEGTFEKLSSRLRRRRAWRIGGIVATLTVALAAVLLLTPATPQQQAPVADASLQSQVTVAQQTDSRQQDNHTTIQQNLPKPSTNSIQLPSANQSTATVQETTTQKDTPIPQPTVASAPQQQALTATNQTKEHTTIQPAEPAKPQPNQSTSVGSGNADTTYIAPVEQPLQQPSPKASEPEPAPYHEDNILWIPNVIVPGDENISNRTFRIRATSEISDFNIHIYNRGGRLLFSSNNPAFTWDATIEGMPVPQGAYVWVVTYRDTDGTPHKQAGTVTVVR